MMDRHSANELKPSAPGCAHPAFLIREWRPSRRMSTANGSCDKQSWELAAGHVRMKHELYSTCLGMWRGGGESKHNGTLECAAGASDVRRWPRVTHMRKRPRAGEGEVQQILGSADGAATLPRRARLK